jgi:hypothetical protein
MAKLGKSFDMESIELVEVRKLLDRGKRVYIGRDAAGRHKLKTMQTLRREYNLDRD